MRESSAKRFGPSRRSNWIRSFYHAQSVPPQRLHVGIGGIIARARTQPHIGGIEHSVVGELLDDRHVAQMIARNDEAMFIERLTRCRVNDASGTKRTSNDLGFPVAIGGKADVMCSD